MVDTNTTGLEKSAGAVLIGYVIAIVTFFCGFCIYYNYIYRSGGNSRRNLFGQTAAQRGSKLNCALEYVLTELENCSPFGCQFVDEILLSHEQFCNKNFKGGVFHLANALAWSEEPRRLLEVMRMTLSPSMYDMLISEILNPVALKGDKRSAIPSPMRKRANFHCHGRYCKMCD